MTKDGHETLSFYLPRGEMLLYTEATGGEFTGHRMADEVREILKNQLFHQNKDRKS